MKQPVIKFERVHWWILLIALLAGVVTFFALHRHAYWAVFRRILDARECQLKRPAQFLSLITAMNSGAPLLRFLN